MKLILKLMEKIPFFWEMTEQERAVFAEGNSFFQVFNDGELIIREGDQNDFSLYVIINGKVVVRKAHDPEGVIAQLEGGAILGEASFLAGRPRIANVFAKGQVTVFKIDREAMKNLDYPLQIKIKDRLAEILVERLEKTNHDLAHALS